MLWAGTVSRVQVRKRRMQEEWGGKYLFGGQRVGSATGGGSLGVAPPGGMPGAHARAKDMGSGLAACQHLAQSTLAAAGGRAVGCR